MPGPSRSTQRGGPSNRRDGAQRQRRTRRQPAARQSAAGWLVAPRGLRGCHGPARGWLDCVRQPDPSSAAASRARLSQAPPAPPPLTVLPPTSSVTRADTIDLTAMAPPNLRSDQHYSCASSSTVSSHRAWTCPTSDQFTLRNVPLARGPQLDLDDARRCGWRERPVGGRDGDA